MRAAASLESDTARRHLLTLKGMTRERIEALLDMAQGYCSRPGRPVRPEPVLAGRTVANLFFEPSTRTRCSFELAARRLGAEVLNIDIDASSTVKGESLLDTFATLQAMHIDLFVVRHKEGGTPELLARNAEPHTCVVNAGEGNISHPTQGLLDALTIRQHKKDFSNLTVAIVGDVRHSRVAASACQVLNTLGVRELRLVGPAGLLPDAHDAMPGTHFTDMDEGIADADVVMMLRIQTERMESSLIPDSASYFRQYGLNAQRLALARPDAIVMHPGPMNRGVEIASDVADGPRSVILEQVANGVAVRMAVMRHLIETTQETP